MSDDVINEQDIPFEDDADEDEYTDIDANPEDFADDDETE